jgi:hypothetical protein
MNIILGYRQDIWKDKPVECYPRASVYYLEQLGHKVVSVGEGHGFRTVDDLDWRKWDVFIEIENGRNKEGKLFFQQPKYNVALPTAVWLIDALAVDTPLLTSKGWTTMAELSIGDKVFSPEGVTTNVIGVSPIYLNRDCYKLIFDNDEEIIADATHKWEVDDRKFPWRQDRVSILTTEQLYKSYEIEPHRYQIPVTAPLTFDNAELPIGPYTLGAWLGDGCSHNGRITSVDKEIIDNIKTEGWTVKPINTHKFEYSIGCGLKGKGAHGKGFQGKLKLLNVWKNKHIPESYLYASIDCRLALAQGLMDTDGECAKDGQAYFHSKSTRLVLQVKLLLESLGYKVHKKTYPKRGSGYCIGKQHVMHRLSFKPIDNMPIFRVKRKLSRLTPVKRVHPKLHRIVSIAPIETVPVKCIYVDSSSHTFLAGRSLIPTHNSHGHPDLHKAVSSDYDHVFFAVWARRDLYADHPSAHWCPNSSDPRWFDWTIVKNIKPKYDFGFIGSKGGLERAKQMVEICERNGYTYTVKQVSKAHRHKWPHCAKAMAEARFLFNRGQKHDGPNQRVIESMLLNRPLLSDLDERDGMSKLFVENYHFLGYRPDNLEEKMKWLMENESIAKQMAYKAYCEAYASHTIKERMKQILEVLG